MPVRVGKNGFCGEEAVHLGARRAAGSVLCRYHSRFHQPLLFIVELNYRFLNRVNCFGAGKRAVVDDYIGVFMISVFSVIPEFF